MISSITVEAIGLPNSGHHGNHPALHRTDQIRKDIYPYTKPMPQYARATLENTSTTKTSIDKAHLARTFLQRRLLTAGTENITHEIQGRSHISRVPSYPIHPSPQKRPRSSSMPPTAQNNVPRAQIDFPCWLGDRTCSQPAQPPPAFRTESAPNFAIFRQGCCSADPATRFSRFWGAGDLLIRVLGNLGGIAASLL